MMRIPRTKRKMKTETTIPITGPAWRPVCFSITVGVGVVLEAQSVVGSAVVLLSLRHCVGHIGSEVKIQFINAKEYVNQTCSNYQLMLQY